MADLQPGTLVTFPLHLFLLTGDPNDDLTGEVEEVQGERIKVWVTPGLCDDWEAGELWLSVTDLTTVTPPLCGCGAPAETDGECASCERIQRNHPGY